MKKCSKCLETKPLSSFYKESSNKKDGRRGDCKDCLKARQKQSYTADIGASKYQKSKNSCDCGKTKSRYAIKCRECCNVFDPNNPNWYTNSKGYTVAYTPNGQIIQHRVVMEEHLGRALLVHENVHHKNGIRSDNRIENLELWSTAQPAGQRVEDKLDWCRWFINQYEGEKNQEGS